MTDRVLLAAILTALERIAQALEQIETRERIFAADRRIATALDRTAEALERIADQGDAELADNDNDQEVN